ncbi:MAG: CopG family transcriptional regulator [bacterium]
MTTLTKRATVYMEPTLHRALRLKSIELSRSVSDLLNDAVRADLADDATDLASFDARKHEPTVSFETFVRELKRHGTI